MDSPADRRPGFLNSPPILFPFFWSRLAEMSVSPALRKFQFHRENKPGENRPHTKRTDFLEKRQAENPKSFPLTPPRNLRRSHPISFRTVKPSNVENLSSPTAKIQSNNW
jgi:hypothetical protein